MSVYSRLRKQFARFEAQVFSCSTELTKEDLEAWLEYDFKEASQNKVRKRSTGAGFELPAHPGPRVLLDYQQEIVQAAYELIQARDNCIIALPTGAGKTTTAVHLLFQALSEGHSRIAWLAPQRLLAEQAFAEFSHAWWSVKQLRSVNLCLTDKILASVLEEGHTVAFDTLQKWLNSSRWVFNPEIVIIDECHHIEANEFGRLVDRLQKAGAVVIGLTATPGRRMDIEGGGLRSRFGGNLIVPRLLGEEPVKTLQTRQVYSQLRHHHIKPTYSSDRELVQLKKGVVAPSLASLSPGRLDAIVNYARAKSCAKQGIIFAYSIAHCHVIAAALHRVGIGVSVIDGRSPDIVNQNRIRGFMRGDVQYLVNVRYLAVGADLPTTDLVLLSVPVGSPILFEQIVGRVCRGPLVGGSESAVIADFDDHLKRFGAPRSYARFKSDWL